MFVAESIQSVKKGKEVELPSERIERERRQRNDFLKSPLGKTEFTAALEKLKSGNPEDRIAGAKKLGDLKALEGFEALLDRLRGEEDKSVRIAVLCAIREVAGWNEGQVLTKGIEPLKKIILTENYEVAKEAIWGLAMCGDTRTMLPILSQLRSKIKNEDLKYEINHALERISYR